MDIKPMITGVVFLIEPAQPYREFGRRGEIRHWCVGFERGPRFHVKEELSGEAFGTDEDGEDVRKKKVEYYVMVDEAHSCDGETCKSGMRLPGEVARAVAALLF